MAEKAVLLDGLFSWCALRQDERSKALSEITSKLFRMDELRRRLVGMVSALDVRYDFGEGHPLLGRRTRLAHGGVQVEIGDAAVVRPGGGLTPPAGRYSRVEGGVYPGV